MKTFKFPEAVARQQELRDKVTEHEEALKVCCEELQAINQALEKVTVTVVIEAPKEVMAKGTVKRTATKKSTAKGNAKKTVGVGRKTKGNRPPLRKAMVSVMGSQTMNARDIVEALTAKDWLPESKDARQYISLMLSSNSRTEDGAFERTEHRGYYRVRPGYTEPQGSTAKRTAKKNGGSKPKKNGKSKDVDSKLATDFGEDFANGNVDSNPFEATAAN